nr:adenylate kinase [Arthrobacter sp. EPSL27]
MVIIGPPGAGKSTQARLVASFLGLTTVSTDDILRAHVRSRTSLGVQAKMYLDTGALVPDSVTNRLVRGRLSQMVVKKGVVLDGYPRTRAQAILLDDILAASENKLDVVLQLTAHNEELLSRRLGWASQAQRSAETAETFLDRVELHQQQTREVAENYSSRGVLTSVNGMGAIEEVSDRVLKTLRERVGGSLVGDYAGLIS